LLFELGHDRGYLASGSRGPFRYNLSFLPLRAAVGTVSPGYLGFVDEFPYWNAVFELYRKDQVKQAVDLMEKIGIGMYADYATAGDIIYLEAATGDDSEIIRVADRLEVECIREQLPFAFDDLGHRLYIEYGEVRSTFGETAPEVDTLLSLLMSDAAIPTAIWRDGYFTPKTPYGKICLPMPQSIDRVLETFRRGLVYQFAFEASAGQADLWLLEAATVLVGSLPSPSSLPDDEGQLNRALFELDDTPAAIEHLGASRGCCHRIGNFLLDHGGPAQLVKCIEYHSVESHDFGVGRMTDKSLKATYGMCFDELLAALKSP